MKKIVTALCLSLLAAQPAFADRDDKSDAFRHAPSPTTALPPATVVLPGIAQSLSQLQAQGGLADLNIDWEGLQHYYAESGGRVLWIGPSGLSETGTALLGQMRRAVETGMPASASLRAALTSIVPPVTPEQAAATEAMLSALLTATALEAQGPLGSSDSRGAGIIAKLAVAKDQQKFLQMQLPGYPDFWRLYGALPIYAGYYHAGGWPTVPGTEKMEPGDSGDRVEAVKQRLLVTGELKSFGADPKLYDDELKLAAQKFQRDHGLNDDGVIGKRTIEEMNVSAEQRLKTILLNLERMRTEGSDFESRHLLVNIPATELKVIDNGQLIYYTKAIVGRVERKTPLLSSVVTQVKLNPDWSVPAKIAAVDMLRHELEEPGYFARRNVHVYTSDGREISPGSVNWREVKDNGYFPYRLKQDPGPENALGPMKLDFKNDHAVFIHGTSAPELFVKQDRFFSSGCVRVEDPLGLVTFLLSDKPDWNRERIDATVKTGKTEFVGLSQPLPLHFVYRTAWVDEAGVMQFRKDVYNRDKAVGIPEALKAPQLLASTTMDPEANHGNNK